MTREPGRVLRAVHRHAELWRWVAVVAAVLVGLATQGFPHAREQLYVLKFLALVVVSVFCGAWPLLAGLEVGLGLAWLVVVRRGLRSWPARLVVDLNRTVGHVEAVGPLLILAMLLDAPASLRFGAVAGLVAWGPPGLDRAVTAWHQRRHGRAPTAAWVRRARRLPMYGVTVLGTVALALLAPGQWRALLPSAVAVLAGMAVRLGATFHRRQPDEGLTDRQWDQLADAALAVAVVALAGYGSWVLARPPEAVAFSPRISAAQCAPAPPEPPHISLFLLGDTQFHELRGQRSAAHLPMVDAVVPVAVRPVALDLLSGVTLDQFARIYRGYAQARPGTRTNWAFLGDLGDIGCSTELDRYPSYFKRFEGPGWTGGPGHLAGIASGNHDNTFVGNFLWHPDWDPACEVAQHGRSVGHRLDKPRADAAILALARQFGAESLRLPTEPVRGLAAIVEGRSALPMASELGLLPAGPSGRMRPVTAVFLDTGDSALWQFGVAGSQGHISAAQIEAAEALVPADAWIVLLLHHPLDQLGPFSRRRLGQLAARWGDRLLLVVSAHTHRSAWHPAVPLGDATVAELTVGSTTDPTQEAAVLEIRGDADAPSLHAITVPAVRRAGMDCAALSDIDAATCSAELEGIARDCTQVAEDDFRQRLHDPEEMTEHQRQLATALLRCLGVQADGDPLDPEVYTAHARRDPAAHRRLVCLSWAASILQGHKGAGWRYVDAARCADERSTTLGGFAVHGPPTPGAAIAFGTAEPDPGATGRIAPAAALGSPAR